MYLYVRPISNCRLDQRREVRMSNRAMPPGLRLVPKASVVFLLACFHAGPALGGRNAGGTLILHADTSIIYTDSNPGYCDQFNLAQCDSAVTSVSGTGPVVFFAVASFPEGAEPRLAGLTFGLDYDDAAITLLDWGSCGSFELPYPGWPAPSTGTAVTWSEPSSATAIPVYWFSGYGSGDPAALSLTIHPTQGAAFADDFVPANIDLISDFGALGFGGNSGYRPCPQPAAQAGGGQGDEPGSEEAPCIFPAQVTIAPGTFLALEADSSTIVLTEETVTVDWSPGADFTVNDRVHFPARVDPRIPDPEDLLEAYRGVPLVEDLLEAGMFITEAALTYSNAYGALNRQAASEYFASIASGASPLHAASLSRAVFTSSQLVRSVQEPRQAGSSILIEVEYHGRDGTTPLVLPMNETPRIRSQLEASEACERLESIIRFLSTPSDTKRLLILRNGSRSIRTGNEAEKYLDLEEAR